MKTKFQQMKLNWSPWIPVPKQVIRELVLYAYEPTYAYNVLKKPPPAILRPHSQSPYAVYHNLVHIYFHSDDDEMSLWTKASRIYLYKQKLAMWPARWKTLPYIFRKIEPYPADIIYMRFNDEELQVGLSQRPLFSQPIYWVFNEDDFGELDDFTKYEVALRGAKYVLTAERGFECKVEPQLIESTIKALLSELRAVKRARGMKPPRATNNEIIELTLMLNQNKIELTVINRFSFIPLTRKYSVPAQFIILDKTVKDLAIDTRKMLLESGGYRIKSFDKIAVTTRGWHIFSRTITGPESIRGQVVMKNELDLLCYCFPLTKM